MRLPILSAILGIIAFLPFNFYPVAFVFLAPLFLFFLKEKKLWRMILGALIFRFIFFLGTIYFTLEPLAWGSGLLIFACLPIVIWLVKKFIARPCAALAALPFLWTFFDLVASRYSFLPSYAITAGNALGSSPFIGLAVFGGPIGLTFFAALINALIATAISKVRPWNAAAIFILLFTAYFISQNQLRKNASAYENLPGLIKIAAVSTNENFNRGQFEEMKTELSGKQLDLVIFPEDVFSSRASSFDNQMEFFQNLTKELDTDILAIFDAFSGGKKYNSAMLFGENGQISGIHNKKRLTFIGEYWPFGKWQPIFYGWLAKINPKIKNYAVFEPRNAYSRGDENILQIKGINFAALICLEIQYPWDIKKYKKEGARFIANPTSNRWIGKGAKHFLYLTNNLRKIESVWLELPIVSSGVKDFAGVILPDGQISLIDYQAGGKNYGVFFGEIKY